MNTKTTQELLTLARHDNASVRARANAELSRRAADASAKVVL